MDAITAQLDLLIRARSGLIHVVSRDELPLEAYWPRLGPSVFSWDIARGWRDTESDRGSLTAALHRVRQHRGAALFLLRDVHPFLLRPLDHSDILRELKNLAVELPRDRQTLILLTPQPCLPADLQELCPVVEVPLPRPPELEAIIQHSVVPRDVHLSPLGREQLVKACQGLTHTRIQHLLSRAIAAHGCLDERAIDTIGQSKQEAIRQTGLLEVIPPQTSLQQVGGLDRLKQWVRQRRDAFTESARRFGIPAPKGLLLVGIQGTGKSLSAKTIAHEWRLPLLRLDLGRIFGGIVGESEDRTRQMIQLTEANAPCVLWIDELDKAFGSGLLDGDSGTSRRVFGTLITWLQEKTAPVFVVATANNVAVLPAELLRKGRFDEIFFLGLPNEAERSEILRLFLHRLRPTRVRDFDLGAIARQTKNFSGAELEQLLTDALHHAYAQNRDLQPEDLILAAEATVPLAAIAPEQVQEIQQWAAKTGARPASSDFDLWQELQQH
jgi:SpoVK/Ycf46/Vps4 family AAA+-type ATPase